MKSNSIYADLAIAYLQKGDTTRSQAALAELTRMDPKFTIKAMAENGSIYSQAYKDYWEKTRLPAARRAGIPE